MFVAGSRLNESVELYLDKRLDSFSELDRTHLALRLQSLVNSVVANLANVHITDIGQDPTTGRYELSSHGPTGT